MEIRSPISTIFILFLLATPCFSSKGTGSENAMDSEVYEIDYRGPETHSSQLSPPDHTHGRPWIHQQNNMGRHKPKGFRGGPKGGKATKIHA